MINFSEVPENDRCCVNCIFFGKAMDTGDEHMCGGVRLCSNYHEDNTENFFIPDDGYLKSEYGCAACEYDPVCESSDICENCSRHYPDLWRRQT